MSEYVPGIGERMYVKTTYPRTGSVSYSEFTLSRETRQSWVTDYGALFLKRECVPISKQEYEDARFVQDHAHSIGRDVQWLKDPAILRQIAALIGYEEGK